MDLVEELEKGVAISHFSVTDKCDLLNDDLLSLTSSDPLGSALLAEGQEEPDVAVEGEEVVEPSQPACPAS